jgi:GTP-binding protein
MRAEWGTMAEEYLAQREKLVLCVQLVDARHEPSKLDRQLNEWLVHYQKPHIVVATKSDKLSRNELQKTLKVIRQTFKASDVLPYSSETATGRDEVWSRIIEAVGQR